MATKRKWTVGLLAALWLLGASVRIANLGNVRSRSPDERVYTVQATTFLMSGFRGTRALVQEYLRNAELRNYPPPNRIGYSLLLAATMKVTDIADERAGAYLACVASMLSLAVAILTGLRFFGGWITIFATLFLSLFPPDLVIARRCWQDSLIGLAGILMFYFTLEIFNQSKSLLPCILLAAVGSVASLIKETSILIYGPCLGIAIWTLAVRRRDLARAGVFAGAVAVGALTGVALLAVATGGVAVPLRIVFDQAHANAVNPYALTYMTGPGYTLLLGFEALSPLIFNLAAVGLLIAILGNDKTRVLLAWLVVGLIAAFALVPHWLNLRYLSAVFAPLCLFAGLAVWRLTKLAERRLSRFAFRAVAVFGLLAIAGSLYSDYRRFERAFVQSAANDLSVGVIFAAIRN